MAEYMGPLARNEAQRQVLDIKQHQQEKIREAIQAPVTQGQACKALVKQMVDSIHRKYHADPTGALKEEVDIYIEKQAIEELEGFITRAVNVGAEDLSYLSPLREQLAICFNRASLEMQKPASQRCNTYYFRKENTAAEYDDAFYIEICEKTALNMKKIEEAQAAKEAAKDPLANKPRFTTPTIPATPK